MSAAPRSPAQQGAERGHDCRGDFFSTGVDLDLAHAADADLDGTFEATCMDTGEVLQVNGWLFVREEQVSGR